MTQVQHYRRIVYQEREEFFFFSIEPSTGAAAVHLPKLGTYARIRIVV